MKGFATGVWKPSPTPFLFQLNKLEKAHNKTFQNPSCGVLKNTRQALGIFNPSSADFEIICLFPSLPFLATTLHFDSGHRRMELVKNIFPLLRFTYCLHLKRSCVFNQVRHYCSVIKLRKSSLRQAIGEKI